MPKTVQLEKCWRTIMSWEQHGNESTRLTKTSVYSVRKTQQQLHGGPYMWCWCSLSGLKCDNWRTWKNNSAISDGWSIVVLKVDETMGWIGYLWVTCNVGVLFLDQSVTIGERGSTITATQGDESTRLVKASAYWRTGSSSATMVNHLLC